MSFLCDLNDHIVTAIAIIDAGAAFNSDENCSPAESTLSDDEKDSDDERDEEEPPASERESDDNDEEDENEDEEDTRWKHYAFPGLDTRIRECISLYDVVFPKLNFTSPRVRPV